MKHAFSLIVALLISSAASAGVGCSFAFPAKNQLAFTGMNISPLPRAATLTVTHNGQSVVQNVIIPAFGTSTLSVQFRNPSGLYNGTAIVGDEMATGQATLP
jgi:hypothetical protein